MACQTEYEFTLPKGYVEKDGKLHRKGVMRLDHAVRLTSVEYRMLGPDLLLSACVASDGATKSQKKPAAH